MKINWVNVGAAIVIDTVFKVCAARALFPTRCKCSLGKDNTFLIDFEPAAVVAVLFISSAACTRCQGSVA